MKDGGPAFPTIAGAEVEPGIHFKGFQGMSIRDYFAAAALTGLLASPHPLTMNGEPMPPKRAFPFGIYAITAYSMADAMLSSRHSPEAP